MSQAEMLEAARQEYEDEGVQLDVPNIFEPGNEFLQEIVDQFMKSQRDHNMGQIACFYELKPTNIGKMIGKENRIVS